MVIPYLGKAWFPGRLGPAQDHAHVFQFLKSLHPLTTTLPACPSFGLWHWKVLHLWGVSCPGPSTDPDLDLLSVHLDQCWGIHGMKKRGEKIRIYKYLKKIAPCFGYLPNISQSYNTKLKKNFFVFAQNDGSQNGGFSDLRKIYFSLFGFKKSCAKF